MELRSGETGEYCTCTIQCFAKNCHSVYTEIGFIFFSKLELNCQKSIEKGFKRLDYKN